MLKRLAFLLIFTAAGCSNDSQTNETINLLVHSDLKKQIPALKEVERKTGVKINAVVAGENDIEDAMLNSPAVDAVWLSDDRSIRGKSAIMAKVQARESIGASPVILAVKKDYALHWGWTEHPNEVSWLDVIGKFSENKLQFGMLNPASSTAGLVTLLQLNTVFSIFGDSDDYASQIKRFFENQLVTSGDQEHLISVYLGEEDRLDAIFGDEASLLELNKKSKKDLFFVYPKEGVLFEDYPFILLNPAKASAFSGIAKLMQDADFQRWQVQNTLVRPVNFAVSLTADFQKDSTAYALPAFYTGEEIDQYLNDYFYLLKKPSHIVYVLDNSGSMVGNRLKALKAAMSALAGREGGFDRLLTRETVDLITYHSKVDDMKSFSITAHPSALEGYNVAIEAMDAHGGSVGYEALYSALEGIKDRVARDTGSTYSIVYYMDGPSSEGKTIADVQTYFNKYQYEFTNLRIFIVIDKDAPLKEAESLAKMSRGKVFDANNKSLSDIMKEVKTYQ